MPRKQTNLVIGDLLGGLEGLQGDQLTQVLVVARAPAVGGVVGSDGHRGGRTVGELLALVAEEADLEVREVELLLARRLELLVGGAELRVLLGGRRGR